MNFSYHLTSLRTHANLTNRQLAELANVPHSLIAGLQSGRRRIGENNARKIGNALGLDGEPLEQFVYRAIDGCTEKVLEECKPYPAELINLVGKQLRRMGISPERVQDYEVEGSNVHLSLVDGNEVNVGMNISYT